MSELTGQSALEIATALVQREAELLGALKAAAKEARQATRTGHPVAAREWSDASQAAADALVAVWQAMRERGMDPNG